MAQRHPTYFDGIVVGAPAMRTQLLRHRGRVGRDDGEPGGPARRGGKAGRAPAFSDADRKTVIDGLLAACDAADGLRDGIVSDPIGCRFDPGTLACAGAKADGCLTRPQAEALPRRSRVRRTRTDGQVYPGFLFDTGIAATQGIPGLLAGSTNPVGPPFTATEMDVEKRAEDAAAQPQMQLTATSSWTNLNTFSSRGGKLLFFHGASDPWFSALDTIDYYERMTRANGGASVVTGWSRLFLVPGMGHCGGGPATLDTFDMLGAVVDWVESQKPPQAIRATGRSWPGRSRPLCPYPSHAHYKGTGDAEDAASFECRQPEGAARPREPLVRIRRPRGV